MYVGVPVYGPYLWQCSARQRADLSCREAPVCAHASMHV